jgi:hypothetical protein
MTAYEITTYRTRFEGVAGFGGRDVRSDEETVTVTDRAGLIRELDANGVPGRLHRDEVGSYTFGGYVTEWRLVERVSVPHVGDVGDDGTVIVMISGGDYPITQAMVDAEIARSASREFTASSGAPCWIVGINASSNMFA